MSIQRSFQRARPVSTLLLEIQVFLAEVTPFFFLLLINTQATLAPWPPIPAYLTEPVLSSLLFLFSGWHQSGWWPVCAAQNRGDVL